MFDATGCVTYWLVGSGSPVWPTGVIEPSADTVNVQVCLLIQPAGQSPEPTVIAIE